MSSPNVFYGPLKDEIERPPDSETETEVEDTPKRYKRLRRERHGERQGEVGDAGDAGEPSVAVDVVSRAGQRELVARAARGDLQYVGSGLQLGWVPNGEAVVGAARGGHTEVLGMLLAFVPGNVSFGGITPLAGAIMGGSMEAVELLLEKPVNFAWRDPRGQSYRDLAKQSTPEIKEAISKLYKERRERRNSRDEGEPRKKEKREAKRDSLPKEQRRDSLPKEQRRDSLPKAPAARPDASLMKRRESEKREPPTVAPVAPVPVPAPAAAAVAPKKFSLMDYKNLRFKKPKKEAEEAERKKREAEERERERQEQERQEQEREREERRREAERKAERAAKELEAREREAKELETKELEAKELEAKELEAKELEAKELEAKELEAKELEAKELEAKELEATKLKAKELELKELKELKAKELELKAQENQARLEHHPSKPTDEDVDMDATITLSAQEIEEQARASPYKLSARDSVPQYILKNETAVESPSSVDSPIESPRNPMQELLQKRERERRQREAQMLQRLEQQEKLQRPDRAASESPAPAPQPIDISRLPTVLKRLACTGKPQDVGPLFAHRPGGASSDKALVLDVQVGALFGTNLHASHPNLFKTPVSAAEKAALWEFCRDWTEDTEQERELFCQFGMFWVRASQVKEALGDFEVIPVVLNAPNQPSQDSQFAQLAETLPVHLVQRIVQRQQVWGWE